jgi:hypothetical protein
MKAILAILLLAFSLSSMAARPLDIVHGTTLFVLSPIIIPSAITFTVDSNRKLIADQINDYNENGEISIELQSVVADLQADNETLSVNEAIDIIQELLVKIK